MEFSRATGNLIANLRGLPEDRRKSRVRPAFELGSLIEVIEQKYKIGQDKLEDRITQHWKDIVGEKLAHRSNPLRIVSGAVLLIQAANPVLRQEMEFRRDEYLDRIHALPGGGAIKELNFRAG